jgi:AcrR family transcriptional regulator
MGRNTKDQILRAAVKAFAKKGYKNATVREIVSLAGAQNLNSVVYYFGSKEKLYKAVLEFMFEEADKFRDTPEYIDKVTMSSEERLSMMIRFMCKVMYAVESDLDQDLYSIFVKEVANPSPFFDEMVDRYMKPNKECTYSILRDYLGENTPEEIIQKCEYSISAQIMHYALAWSIISRINPDHTPLENQIEELAEHVIRFSIGGLKMIRAQLDSGDPQ